MCNETTLEARMLFGIIFSAVIIMYQITFCFSCAVRTERGQDSIVVGSGLLG